jgi:hypothetical protein
MSDFAEHWSARLMPEMRRRARIIAIRIVTASDAEWTWETFSGGLAELEDYAHHLGASHMPEAYERALHDELRRELVESIALVLAPWREAQLRAGIVGADVERWDRQVREWAGFAEPKGDKPADET